MSKPGSGSRPGSPPRPGSPGGNENAFGFVQKGVDRHMRWGRRTITWKKCMRFILNKDTPEREILVLLQTVNGSNEIRACEISVGDSVSRYGTLMHACAVSGRIPVAMQLIRYGADPKAVNYHGETPNDLALRHGQVAMSEFLEPTRTTASVAAAPAYAKDERDLVWGQRKRRKQLVRHLQEAKLSRDEERGAHEALDAREREEWMHLEGSYMAKGLALDTIEDMKTRRSMY